MHYSTSIAACKLTGYPSTSESNERSDAVFDKCYGVQTIGIAVDNYCGGQLYGIAADKYCGAKTVVIEHSSNLGYTRHSHFF